MNNNNRFLPLLLSLCVIIGILLGTFFTQHYSDPKKDVINAEGIEKVDTLLRIIDRDYVDTISLNDLVEKTLPKILAELDPHSKYIQASDVEQSQEDLVGHFSGIGIRFSMINDTVTVMNIVKGGPSERSGLLTGDRLVKANNDTLVGITDQEVMKLLRGEKGTKVTLTALRRGSKKPLTFEIVRGDVPIETVNAYFMLNDHTGYIAIKSFGSNTYSELLVALAELSFKGMEDLIIDLRGNGGGYMEICIYMVNEFLGDNRLIVYTDGRNAERQDFRSDGRGAFQNLPLVVLVDELSASASEIFAGAIQDNDRGTLIGRRSFGKGLVQTPYEFKDGSMVRLTIARYYTPSGRCIQRPYEPGKGEEYYDDLLLRYERGEFFTQDSIHLDGPEYKTRLGRTVYGGGGIMPDIFVPDDTTLYTSYFKEAVFNGLTAQYAFEFADRNRRKLESLETASAMESWLKQQNIVEQFATFASQHGLPRRNLMLHKSAPLFERNLFSYIIYNAGDEALRLQYLCKYDPTIKEALKVLENGEATPTK